MHITYENNLMMIIDDFLSSDAFALFWNYVQSERFEYVHAKEWVSAFSLNDGNPLWSRPAISHPRASDSSNAFYPTKTGFDLFISALLDSAPCFQHLVGKQNIDWDFFFSRIYLYPKEAGLSWHTDGKYDISGAYVFYAHPEWRASWGAELQINSKISPDFEYPLHDIGCGQKRTLGFHLDNSAVDDALNDPGFGYFVFPKPNRLILIRNKLLHQIKKVDQNAGNKVRCSVTGFFMSDNKIKEIRERHAY